MYNNEHEETIFIKPKVYTMVIRPGGRLIGFQVKAQYRDNHTPHVPYYLKEKIHLFIPLKADGIISKKLGRNSRYEGYILVKIQKNKKIRNKNEEIDVETFKQIIQKLNSQTTENYCNNLITEN